MKWINVEKELPRTNAECLVYDESIDIFIATYDDEDHIWTASWDDEVEVKWWIYLSIDLMQQEMSLLLPIIKKVDG